MCHFRALKLSNASNIRRSIANILLSSQVWQALHSLPCRRIYWRCPLPLATQASICACCQASQYLCWKPIRFQKIAHCWYPHHLQVRPAQKCRSSGLSHLDDRLQRHAWTNRKAQQTNPESDADIAELEVSLLMVAQSSSRNGEVSSNSASP